MSANNFVLVKKKGTVLSVQHCDADTGSQIEFLGTFYSLDEAVEQANKFFDKNEVEYGLKIEI